LNCIRRELVKDVKFPNLDHGEDTDWAMSISKKGLLKNEYYSDKTLYYYDFKTGKLR